MRKKLRMVAGLDEAGRGPLAGPVVACAVTIIKNPIQNHNSQTLKLRDSKKLTPKAREKFYKILTTHPGILWGMGRVSEKVIDKINILEATKLAMVKAIKNLEKKLYRISHGRRKCDIINFLILDGKMHLDLPICQRSIVKADEKVFSCKASSIIAKVTRDRIMKKYHKRYPQYGFDKHKGYPTKFHYRMLKRYGPCQIHRKSFNIREYGRSKTTQNKITTGSEEDASFSQRGGFEFLSAMRETGFVPHRLPKLRLLQGARDRRRDEKIDQKRKKEEGERVKSQRGRRTRLR